MTFGRLKMSVDDAIAACKQVMGTAIADEKEFYSVGSSNTLHWGKPKGYYSDSKSLEDAIKSIVKQYREDPEVKLNTNPAVNSNLN